MAKPLLISEAQNQTQYKLNITITWKTGIKNNIFGYTGQVPEWRAETAERYLHDTTIDRNKQSWVYLTIGINSFL